MHRILVLALLALTILTGCSGSPSPVAPSAIATGQPTLSATEYNRRGSEYNSQGQYDLAIADLNKAIEMDPKYAAAHNNRGYAYLKQNKYDLAIADLNKAIELDPKAAIAYNNRARSYYGKGQKDLAIKDLRQCKDVAQQTGDNSTFATCDGALKELGAQ